MGGISLRFVVGDDTEEDHEFEPRRQEPTSSEVSILKQPGKQVVEGVDADSQQLEESAGRPRQEPVGTFAGKERSLGVYNNPDTVASSGLGYL